MKKHTHKGNCQVCGSLQAVRAHGYIANHGYNVEWNQHVGRCYGSGMKPLQEDKSYAEKNIKANEEAINVNLPKMLDEVKDFMPTFYLATNGRTIKDIVTSDSHYDYSSVLKHGMEYKEVTLKQAVELDKIANLYKSGKNRTAEELIEEGRSAAKRRIERHIKSLKAHNEIMKRLVERYYGTPLIPV